MKESVTKFDLEAAFKALDDIDIPKAGSVKANRPALKEVFSRKTGDDCLMEEYYDISSTEGLNDASAVREAEVAKAKLARIEKIVDLDAESPEDLLPSYVGKLIIQCPQCMTLFYKNPEDVEESEDDPEVVNLNEVCQHCGNDSGYTVIGKVGAADEPAEENTTDTTEEDNSEDTMTYSADEEDEDLDISLDDEDLDFELEEDDDFAELDLEDEEKQEESFSAEKPSSSLVEQLKEETELEVSATEFEELINSEEYSKPISDKEVRTMLKSEEATNEDEKTNEALDETATEKLEEGILDKVKDGIEKVADKLKSREAKADWILENALEDYNNIQVSKEGKLEPDESNKRFNAFVVIGFKDKYTNGKLITMAPSFSNKDLVVGMKRPETKDNYKAADNIAKGWSMQQGNGPAFIYLAKSAEDKEAVFLCEYFKGKLAHDQLEKYFKVVKDHLKGAKLMAAGGMNQADDDTIENTDVEESLDIVMANVEDLQENLLEKAIVNQLSDGCSNVANFTITDCSYLQEKLTITGTLNYKTGATEETSYIFTEAFKTTDNKLALKGFNKKFGYQEQFIINGYLSEDKNFITESFTSTRK